MQSRVWMLNRRRLHTNLQGLVGLCYRQNLVSMVGATKFTNGTKQSLAAAAVPLQPLLLVLCASEDLQNKVGSAAWRFRGRGTSRGENWPKKISQTFGLKLLVGRMCSC